MHANSTDELIWRIAERLAETKRKKTTSLFG